MLTMSVPLALTRASVHAAEFNIDELQILTGLILIQELSKIENRYSERRKTNPKK